MNKLTFFFKQFCQAIVNLINHDGVEHAGYMAFLFILSIFPFLVFFVAISGFLGQYQIGAEFAHFVTDNLPQEAISALKPRIDEILNGPPQGLLKIAIIGAIWTSSSSVEGIRTILNRVHEVDQLPPYWFRRVLSIVQFIVMTSILVVAMLVVLFWPIVKSEFKFIEIATKDLSVSWLYLKDIFVFVLLFLVISTTYYYIPNYKIAFRSIVPGAFLAVIGWMGSTSLLSFYLSHFQQFSIIYGSLAGIILSLLFFYIISLIFIFGAEFNQLLIAHKHDSNRKKSK